MKSGSARLGHIPSLPWESQLPLKPCISLQPPDSNGNCDSFDSLFDFCSSHYAVSFAPQMWAARPHLGSIFEKLLHRKTFYLCFAPAQQKTASPDKEKAVSNAILFDAVRNPFRLFPVLVLPFSLAFGWYHFSKVYR